MLTGGCIAARRCDQRRLVSVSGGTLTGAGNIADSGSLIWSAGVIAGWASGQSLSVRRCRPPRGPPGWHDHFSTHRALDLAGTTKFSGKTNGLFLTGAEIDPTAFVDSNDGGAASRPSAVPDPSLQQHRHLPEERSATGLLVLSHLASTAPNAIVEMMPERCRSAAARAHSVFTIAAGATLQAGGYSFDAASSISGAGTVRFGDRGAGRHAA